MKKIDFSKINITEMSNEALDAHFSAIVASGKEVFALESPSIDDADYAEQVTAAKKDVEDEKAKRKKEADEAAERFANARDAFSAEATDAEGDEGTDDDEGDEGTDESEGDEAEGDEAEGDEGTDAEGDEGTDAEGDSAEVTTASAGSRPMSKPRAASAAQRVAAKTKRPARAASQDVVITAAADVPGFSTGQRLSTIGEVAKGGIKRAGGFPRHNRAAAEKVAEASGGAPVMQKVGLASFGIAMDKALVASGSADDEYRAQRNAIQARKGQGDALTAAGWCAPSETVYSYISDYVVDGLVSVPEVSAPRGGLMITTGPAKSNNVDDFGFVQTEAQAEAGQEKPLEVIECPDFVDHRLDAIGYGWTIPFLTQKAYPELITDALKFSSVLYAHKVNKRVLSDMAALSTSVTFSGYGPSTTDSLEALALRAVVERRRWNIGENAVMEVKVPVWAREVYRADMSRRTGLALSDIATDEKIMAEFRARRLDVEFVADWQELAANQSTITLPGSFKAMMFPQGTFIKAIEDVVNLSAFYDTASVVVNEYTGVFFEQGILVAKVGYGSSLVDIPINTAGETGAAILQGLGDAQAAGSF